MTIYLLRHGQTEYNVEKRYQGTRDIPLSDAGRAQLRPADFEPEKVFVSPLSRAVETARILFPNAALETIPDFREMCFGIFEGRNYVEMEHDADYLAWVREPCGILSAHMCGIRAACGTLSAGGAAEARHHGTRRNADGRDGTLRSPAPRLLFLVCGKCGRFCSGRGEMADGKKTGSDGRSVVCRGYVTGKSFLRR